MRIVLPERQPDETLYSLTARISWLNGYPSDQEACALLFGQTRLPRVGDIQVDLVRFCEVTRQAYGRPEDVSALATILPFFRRLGSFPAVETPQALTNGGGSPEMAQESGLAALSNGQAHRWRWCARCKEEDEHHFGVAHWHRVHQLPGVLVCPDHGDSLWEVSMYHWVRQQRFVLPGSLPVSVEARSAWPGGRSADLMMDLAQFARAVLEDFSAGHSTQSVRGAIIDGLMYRGLASRRGKVHVRAFVDAFRGHYAGLGIGEADHGMISKRQLQRWGGMLDSQVHCYPALFILLLAKWLYGSWGMFRERCSWRAVIDATAGDRLATSTSTQSSQGRGMATCNDAHRAVCLEFLRQYPEASRTEFRREHPRSCRWLATYDRDWLDSQLPNSWRRGGRQLLLL